MPTREKIKHTKERTKPKREDQKINDISEIVQKQDLPKEIKAQIKKLKLNEGDYEVKRTGNKYLIEYKITPSVEKVKPGSYQEPKEYRSKRVNTETNICGKKKVVKTITTYTFADGSTETMTNTIT
eukprot:CAMPEP_0205801088 /NCGR_PEP_ID=MMETSP0205-20121125/2964_1 /ASSEMBLY_ACC=CAM_ASM_000278 /TAXON_ID=36767 /ORGANISM="Euplotes focardii, Strain TN1" /LENGTH=125 /DNA_ID=CAMNT_0053065261 /DNA_START=456 /DNA_END=830 /DNA_ORIENTATION=+